MPLVFIPSSLLDRVGAPESVELPGRSLGELIQELEKAFPELEGKLVDDGRLASWIAVLVDGELSPRGLFTTVEPTSEVHFLPAIAGG